MTVERASCGRCTSAVAAPEKIGPKLMTRNRTECCALNAERQLCRHATNTGRVPDCILREAGRLTQLSLRASYCDRSGQKPPSIFALIVCHATRNNSFACYYATHIRLAFVLDRVGRRVLSLRHEHRRAKTHNA